MNLPINQVLLGDAIDVLKSLPDSSIDCLISDPPYNTTSFRWDQKVDWSAFWLKVDRVCKSNAIVAMFAQQPFATDLIVSNRAAFRYEIVWEKPMGLGFLDCNRRPLRCHELILVFCRQWGGKQNQPPATFNPQKALGKPYSRSRQVGAGSQCDHYGQHESLDTASTGDRFPRDVLKFQQVSKGFFNSEGQPGASPDAYHPTQKPLELIKWLVLSYSNPGEVILDPFLGSGTTAVACMETDRHFIGIEKDPGYHAIAQQRLANALPLDLVALQQKLASLGRKLTEAQILNLLSKVPDGNSQR